MNSKLGSRLFSHKITKRKGPDIQKNQTMINLRYAPWSKMTINADGNPNIVEFTNFSLSISEKSVNIKEQY